MIKKLKQKKLLIIISILLSLIMMVFIVFFYSEYNKKVEVVLKGNLKLEVNSDIKLLDLIKKTNNGKILTTNKIIDTSIIGSKKIEIDLVNKYGKQDSYSFNIEVVDTTEPTITFNGNLSVTEGNNINLLDGVSVTDNSKEELTVSIEGDYNLNEPSSYKLYYVVSDSSNNISKTEFTLTVNEKQIVVPPKSNTSNSKITTINNNMTTNGYPIETINGVTYISGIIVVNKTYSLPSIYGNGLTSQTQEAFNQMKNDASSEGVYLNIISGFRSYPDQIVTYNKWINIYGKTTADSVSARPGHSEHQTGLAIDINSLSNSFKNTNEGIWLSDNAFKYGFILRYPENKTTETGYSFEPWHYRYVGIDLANKLYNNGDWLSIEAYFGVTSTYGN